MATRTNNDSIVAQIAVEAVYNALVEYGMDSFSERDVQIVLQNGIDHGVPRFYLDLLADLVHQNNTVAL